LRKTKKKQGRIQQRPAYGLTRVKQLVQKGNVYIRGNALDSARQDFGWLSDDIIGALKKLQSKHFYKSEPSRIKPPIMVDYYKAHGLKGENVYLHFYIEKETLTVNSFKKL
jgi:hypothetical protein